VLYLETPEGPLQARLLVPLAKINPKGLYLDRPRITSLPAGTRVELVGAPTNSALAPILQDAEFRVVRQDPPPVAMPVSAVAALSGRFDRAPISLPARLLAQNRRHDGSPGDGLLLLQSGDVIFEGIWETSGVPALAPPPEARLQVSGVCLNEAGVTERARSFRLLLRAPSDVQVLGRLPPWASWPVGRILAVAGVLGLLALAWIGALRRRVRERTAALATANVRMSAEIEERKRAQSELDRALAAERELSELKSSFVSLISHEFRTPLGITMSAVELLRNYRERLTPAKLKELLDDIYAATLRMSGLMEQALLLGRVEAGKLTHRPGPIDLEIIAGRLVDETLSATQRQCPVQFHAENSLAGAQGDEGLLRHIFSNLLSNAVKYSPDGGEVRFTARRENGQAVFLVRDRGIGIPEADRARLFQAFHRASNVGQTPGTGLGLLIVKRCVELQGGTITYESRAGVGTEFTVRLPLFGPDR
jgi:signal transduction histidine kinase